MDADKSAVALRVLMAVSNHQEPVKGDVALLRAYCPDYRDHDLDPDEIACIVIQQEMHRDLEERRKKTEAAGQ